MARGESKPWVAVTGGGTGGHVYPALSVIRSLRRMASIDIGDRLVWIGSNSGPERSIVTEEGIRFEGIATGKLRRYLSLRNVWDVFRILAGCAQSVLILARYRPAVLFAKGGYVSVPPCVAARLLGIPVVAHESDLDPGLATRINGRFADAVLVPYEQSVEHYADRCRSKLRVVGVPLRDDLKSGKASAGRERIGAPPGKPVLLVLGGSQGARRVNELIARNLDRLCERWYLVHQTGASWRIETTHTDYLPIAYLRDEYADVLSAADCVVCRSGATTLWEAATLGKAMVLLPLGLDASRGDQIRNAAYFKSHDAAWVFDVARDEDKEVLSVLDMLSDDQSERVRAGEAARRLVNDEAASRIADLLASYLRNGSPDA